MDDPRVRADPNDGISAGTQWFDLFGRLRGLPIAYHPTPYNIQANLIAAVYAVGLGKISKAAGLLAEAVTMCIDAGLHRSADNYDLFDPIEDEVRKRTFWCVYIWDKQLAAHFGRPTLLRLRDCDVAEPSPVDDEFITREAIGTPPPGTSCRLAAFIVSLRIMVVLEAVLDVPPARQSDDSTSFLIKATNVLSGVRHFNPMREEEALLDEIHRGVPAYWAHTAETLACDDTIRLTQAVRLHCAEQYVRLLIYRHRFSELVAERTNGAVDTDEQTEQEKEALIAAHNAALQIVGSHLHIAKKGLMTYCKQWNFYHLLCLANSTCRWRPRYPSTDAGGSDFGCSTSLLQDGCSPTSYSSWPGRFEVVHRTFATLQRSLRLWPALRRPHGRVLPT